MEAGPAVLVCWCAGGAGCLLSAHLALKSRSVRNFWDRTLGASIITHIMVLGSLYDYCMGYPNRVEKISSY